MRALTAREQERCIGGHPLCGSETAGVGNARASLYEGATYFLTPGAHVDAEAYRRLYSLLGADRRAPGGSRPRRARPSHGRRQPSAARARQRADDSGRAARRFARCAPLGGAELPRPHAHRGQQSARVDGHLPRQPRGASGCRGHLPGGAAGGARSLAADDPARLEDTITRRRSSASGCWRSRTCSRAISTGWSSRSRIVLGSCRRSRSGSGDANINIEDMSLHHKSAELGGTLTVYVLGEDVAKRGRPCARRAGLRRESREPVRMTVVALDGPVASGKSTVARAVAAGLGYVYLDTGAMYRAVGLLATEAGVALDDEAAVVALALAAPLRFGGDGRLFVGERDVSAAIRTLDAGSAASLVSALPGVRRVLVDQQRALARDSDIVMEGRDIGTNVFPDAEIKVFLTARPDVRAARRAAELQARGEEVDDRPGPRGARRARPARLHARGRAAAPGRRRRRDRHLGHDAGRCRAERSLALVGEKAGAGDEALGPPSSRSRRQRALHVLPLDRRAALRRPVPLPRARHRESARRRAGDRHHQPQGATSTR